MKKRRSWRGSRAFRFAATAVLIPVVVSFISAVAIATWTQVTSSTPLTRTAVSLYFPSPESVPVTKHVAGRCGVSDADFAVSDALLCGSGHLLYDPCWFTYGYSNGLMGGAMVECVETPWSPTGIALHMTNLTQWEKDGRVAKRRPPLAKADPWALELSGGERCVFVAGATYTVAGERANYFCARHSLPSGKHVDGWVIGDIDRTSQPWVVSYAPAGAAETQQIHVRRAWF